MSGKHTIILVQYTANYQSRSYLDFPSVTLALDAVIKLYEHKLKELNPSLQHISYSITDLYAFLDSLTDIAALVLDTSAGKYEPKDREWLKNKILAHLQNQARQN